VLVYLSGPIGPATYPPPDTDPDPNWRYVAKDRIEKAGHAVFEIVDVMDAGLSTASIKGIMEAIIRSSGMVLAHVYENSWQSMYEIRMARRHGIPTYANIVAPQSTASYDHPVLFTFPSIDAAINEVLDQLGPGPGPGLKGLQGLQGSSPTLKVLLDPPDPGTKFPYLSRSILPIQYPGEDCGYDLSVAGDVTIPADGFFDVPCALSMELPPGYWGFITGRSSTFRKKGLLVLPGVIDNGYRGPIFYGIFNTNKHTVHIEAGERLAQIILLPMAVFPVEVVSSLSESSRGDRGFGSSGQ